MNDKPEPQLDTRPDVDARSAGVDTPASDHADSGRSTSRAAELTTSKVLAGGMAAATAAVLGSHYGSLGTVGGAAVGSVITTVGTSLYQRSLERARTRVATRVPGATAIPRPRSASPTPRRGSALRADSPSRADSSSTVRRWARYGLVATVLVFAVGLGLVTGVEWVKGAPLSGGAGGTSVGRLVGPTPPVAPSEPEPGTPAGNGDSAGNGDPSEDADPSADAEPSDGPAPSSPTPPPSGEPPAPPDPLRMPGSELLLGR